MTVAVERINDKLDNLSQTFTPREVHDLALGGIKIDVRWIEQQQLNDKDESQTSVRELAARQVEQERETARRLRQAVTITFTSLLAPAVVALVVFVLTQLTRAATP